MKLPLVCSVLARGIAKRVRAYAALHQIEIGHNCYIFPPRLIIGPRMIHIGDNTTIQSDAWFGVYRHKDETVHPHLVIGNGVYVGHYSCITTVDEVRIGNRCVLSDYVYISDHVHGYDPKSGPILQQQLNSKGPVVVGNDCFLGYRVTVLPGVTLGNNVVVGANSVVTSSFPSYTMIAGAPAREIKQYSDKQAQWISING